MAEPARARVDQQRDLSLVEPERPGRALLVDAVHALQLEEVVARAEGADLMLAPVSGARGDEGGLGPFEASARLGHVQVLLRADPEVLEERPGARCQHAVELHPRHSALAALPATSGRDPPGDLVDQGLAASAELVRVQG